MCTCQYWDSPWRWSATCLRTVWACHYHPGSLSGTQTTTGRNIAPGWRQQRAALYAKHGKYEKQINIYNGSDRKTSSVREGPNPVLAPACAGSSMNTCWRTISHLNPCFFAWPDGISHPLNLQDSSWKVRVSFWPVRRCACGVRMATLAGVSVQPWLALLHAVLHKHISPPCLWGRVL